MCVFIIYKYKCAYISTHVCIHNTCVCVCTHEHVHTCQHFSLTLCNSMDCSPSGSSVCRIFQAKILEWVAISYSRGSSWPRDQICISFVSCIALGFFSLLYIYIYIYINAVFFQFSLLNVYCVYSFCVHS